MFKLSADRITSVLITNEIIKEKEFRVYSYGFELLLAFIANILAVLFIGLILGKVNNTILFLLTYCPIRQYTGGFHAKNYAKCLATFLSIYLATVLITSFVDTETFRIYLSIALVISLIGIYLLSPLEHRHNPLSNYEKIHHKKIATRISVIVVVVNLFSINYNYFSEYFIFSTFALYWIFIMLLLAIVIEKYKIKADLLEGDNVGRNS